MENKMALLDRGVLAGQVVVVDQVLDPQVVERETLVVIVLLRVMRGA
jgi:hypothetical protein